MKSVGVILARLQPIHMGHLALIGKSYKENDETYVFIGSADKFNERNPIPISVRMQLVYEALREAYFQEGCDKHYMSYDMNGIRFTNDETSKSIIVLPLDDLTDESDNSHDWGFYLYSKIVTESHCSNFTIYYSDGFEIITTWFPGFLLRNNVSLSLLSRNAVYSGVSATRVRKAITEDDIQFLKLNVPSTVIEHKDTLRKHIELSKLIK